MGCFLACFGSSKDKKKRHRRLNRNPSGVRDQRGGYDAPVKQVVYPLKSLETVQQAILRDAITPAERAAGFSNEGKLESSTSLISVFRNRDSGVDELRDGVHEPEQDENSTKKGNLASPCRLNSSNVENSCDKLSYGAKKEVIFDSVVKNCEPHATCELVEKDFSGKEKTRPLAKPSTSTALSEAGSSTLSLVSHPPNHRYQNCRESDDEEDGLEYGGSDMDVDDGELEAEEYSDGDMLTDSLCSMKSTSRISAGNDGISQEVNCQKKKDEATDSNRGRDDYDRSLLNPVENLSQWKALKARGEQPLLSRKENHALNLQEIPFGSFSSGPNFHQAASIKSEVAFQEQQTWPMAIDASLSNWLTSPETKAFQNVLPQQTVSQGLFSPKNFDDRPILGALTVEELKLMSRTSSPRTSPTKSPDDMAIIGSVGSHWSSEESDKDPGSVSSYKGIPNTTSKYREDKSVNWHSTPFETRLEKALSRGTART